MTENDDTPAADAADTGMADMYALTPVTTTSTTPAISTGTDVEPAGQGWDGTGPDSTDSWSQEPWADDRAPDPVDTQAPPPEDATPSPADPSTATGTPQDDPAQLETADDIVPSPPDEPPGGPGGDGRNPSDTEDGDTRVQVRNAQDDDARVQEHDAQDDDARMQVRGDGVTADPAERGGSEESAPDERAAGTGQEEQRESSREEIEVQPAVLLPEEAGVEPGPESSAEVNEEDSGAPQSVRGDEADEPGEHGPGRNDVASEQPASPRCSSTEPDDADPVTHDPAPADAVSQAGERGDVDEIHEVDEKSTESRRDAATEDQREDETAELAERAGDAREEQQRVERIDASREEEQRLEAAEERQQCEELREENADAARQLASSAVSTPLAPPSHPEPPAARDDLPVATPPVLESAPVPDTTVAADEEQAQDANGEAEAPQLDSLSEYRPIEKHSNGTLNGIFMKDARATILAGMHDSDGNKVNHPLRKLLDENGQWCSRTHRSEKPTVQAGHLVSRHALFEERFALEDSFYNQVSNWNGETQGAVFLKEAVLIEGVPVELRTARMWVEAGLLKPEHLARAEPHGGWTRPAKAS